MVMPEVCARSWIAAVGNPPLQKKASTLPSFSASADSNTPRPCLVNVFFRIDAIGLHNTERRDFRAAAG